MAKKVYLDPGHGGSDPGAVKYVKEKEANLAIAKGCRDYLEDYGVTVKMSRTGDTAKSINTRAAESNKWGADICVSIHNNAGGGDGLEVLHTYKGGKGKELAKAIETQVKKIGQNSRGLKTRKDSNGNDYFGMIRLPKSPAVICECAFVDNKTDVKIIDTAKEQKAMGEAIAKGILDYFGIKSKATTKSTTATSSKEYKVKITASALNIRAGAGTSYNINGVITDKGVYTITETKGDWGKLKSGKGWINLKYTKKV